MPEKKVKLRYTGMKGPNGEKHNEVKSYKKSEAESLLKLFPYHYEQVEETK